MSENKETKQEVTNEELLRHLKEIETAQGCMMTGMMTLFSLIDKKEDKLELSKGEISMIRHGLLAFDLAISHLNNISGTVILKI